MVLKIALLAAGSVVAALIIVPEQIYDLSAVLLGTAPEVYGGFRLPEGRGGSDSEWLSS